MLPPADRRQWPQGFALYANPARDVERINDSNRHYVLAFLDTTTHGKNVRREYPQAHRNFNGEPSGCPPRTALEFSLEFLDL